MASLACMRCTGALKEGGPQKDCRQEAGCCGDSAGEGIQGPSGCGGSTCGLRCVHCADPPAALRCQKPLPCSKCHRVEPSLYQLADKELLFHGRPHTHLEKHVVAALFQYATRSIYASLWRADVKLGFLPGMSIQHFSRQHCWQLQPADCGNKCTGNDSLHAGKLSLASCGERVFSKDSFGKTASSYQSAHLLQLSVLKLIADLHNQNDWMHASVCAFWIAHSCPSSSLSSMRRLAITSQSAFRRALRKIVCLKDCRAAKGECAKSESTGI